MSKQTTQPNDLYFALDIGTRSVMGILGGVNGEDCFVEYSAVEFHKKRSMIDGQIHDIDKVADCVQLVKDRLEEKSGYKLEYVSIAAAGRSLKTIRLTHHIAIDSETEIDKNMMDSLQIEIIQKAQEQLDGQIIEKSVYYNVGHTVINYYLDDSMIINPIGHHGKKLGVDIIATFLPQIVVDSLEAVMKKVGLKVSYMTLEPIAAIEVAVPVSARLLNLALVDIGAGTSDIAITREGSVVAYGMTSTAGDEITESLATNYLLDFDTAESLKCNLNKEDTQQFTDIVGMKNELKTRDILDSIRDSIELVANNIAENILLQNGKSPSAVFMIGGGSQIPGLGELVAQKLELPKERVVIKGAEHIQSLSKEHTTLSGPEAVTPVGIMVSSAKNQKNEFMDVKVNGKSVRLFRSTIMKVSDALVLSGFNPRDLIPKKGKSIQILINGEEKNFYGKYGEEAKIYCNGIVGNLESKVEDGDEILIEPAVQGVDARVSTDRLKDFDKKIFINGQEYPYLVDVQINGNYLKSGEDRVLSDGDKLTYRMLDRVDKIALYMEMEMNDYDFSINGVDVLSTESIKPYDRVETFRKERKKKNNSQKMTDLPGSIIGENSIQVICNGKNIELKGKKSSFLFIDIFDYIRFDRSQLNGKLIIKHNGKPAQYTAPLNQGDVLEIRWE